MKTKFTPGPWARLNYCVYAAKVEPKLPNIYETLIANTSFEENDLSHEECKANAQLIAAAPQLLEACQSALVELAMIGVGNKPTKMTQIIARKVHEAIAKAEGEE